jgi:catechol 2,3-dioxygenase-like lactoylglutathione lyase family enzyme
MRLLLPLLLLAQLAVAQDKMGIVGHNHMALHVKDMAASTAFFRDVMGFKPIPVPENLKAIRSWFDVGNGQQIHLMAGRTEPIVHDKNASHFALFVEDIAKSETYLKSRNISYHRQVRFDGVVQIYFSDPDGYLWELNEGKVAKAY